MSIHLVASALFYETNMEFVHRALMITREGSHRDYSPLLPDILQFTPEEIRLLVRLVPRLAYISEIDLPWQWAVEAVRAGFAFPVAFAAKAPRHTMWCYLNEIGLRDTMDFLTPDNEDSMFMIGSSTPDKWTADSITHAPMVAWFYL